MRKSADELVCLRNAGQSADRAFARLLASRFEGRSEEAIAADLNQLLREEGLDASDWGPIVASGPNSASPHHMTGDRVVREGDAVVLDFGGTVEGYYADITRTVHVGQPSKEFAKVYHVVRVAQAAGVGAVAPGVKAQDVDRVTREVIEESGFGEFFLHRTGHGLGLEGHEEPYIVEGNTLALEPGMVFSIEPGIYLSGRFGVRIEDIVALGPEGTESMNNATHELQVVH
jgi:Xaa-Pro aminopeptidase